MSTFRLVVVGLTARILNMALTVAYTLILARTLGPSNAGEYFLVVRVVLLLTALADFGVSQSANVHASKHTEWARHIHRILMAVAVVAALITIVVTFVVFVYAGPKLLPNFPARWMWMCFATLPFAIYCNYWNYTMIGLGRIVDLNAVQLVCSFVSLVLIVVFVWFIPRGLEAAILIYLGTTILQSFISYALLHRSLPADAVEPAPVKELPKEIVIFGLRFYLGSVATLLWMRLPVFLLNFYAGPAAVGVFSVAQQLVEKMQLPFQAMQDAIYRRISVLPQDEATAAMNGYSRVTIWLMLGVTAIVMIVVPWAVILVVGPAYARAGLLCRLLLLGTPFMSVSLLLATYYLSQLRRPGLLSAMGIGNAVVNVVLSYALIPHYLDAGAALAVALTQIIGTVATIVIYLRLARTPLREVGALRTSDIATVRQQFAPLLARWRAQS